MAYSIHVNAHWLPPTGITRKVQLNKSMNKSKLNQKAAIAPISVHYSELNLLIQISSLKAIWNGVVSYMKLGVDSRFSMALIRRINYYWS